MQVDVFLNLEGTRHALGRLTDEEGGIAFQYASGFLQSGLEVSPFGMPASSVVRHLPRNVFEGLPGFVADSLPDAWGGFLLLTLLTRYVSLGSIYAAASFPVGTWLFVSHDRYFINRFATRIWELADGTITDYPCGFAQYRQMKAQEEAEKAAAPKPEKEREKPAAERPQRGNKAQQAARRQLTICERDIAKAEERIAALEADMEAAACDYEKLNELVGQKDAAQAELDALYERWEQLSEEAEG